MGRSMRGLLFTAAFIGDFWLGFAGSKGDILSHVKMNIDAYSHCPYSMNLQKVCNFYFVKLYWCSTVYRYLEVLDIKPQVLDIKP